MIRDEESMMIQIMYKQGYSKKRIARELGISINTVRKYIKDDTLPRYTSRPPAPMKLDPYRDYIIQRLVTSSPVWIPATVIFREIKAMGYTGGITMLRSFMRQQKPVAEAGEPIRFETNPGKQMQVDWAEFRQGHDRLAAFVATLGYSRASYVEFVTDEKLTTLLSCHEHAFDYFGGIAHEILYDNMKTVITERNYYGEGQHRLQSGFWDFSKHYGFIPRICRPYRAQTKGKVERFIHYLRHSFYNPLSAELKSYYMKPDINVANQRVLVWLNSVANKRIHGTTQAVPFDRLAEEQPSLQPLIAPYTGVTPCLEPKPAQCAFKAHVSSTEAPLQHELATYDEFLTGDATS